MIKENQNKFFIICLSSAIPVCYYNQIRPDLCLSTDGGYWAGQHLKKLLKMDTILAASSESYCPKNILKKAKILPLDYKEGISSTLFNQLSLNHIEAKRNGTVSGTALELAISLSFFDIFFFGLDLSCSISYQHTLPNELELNNSLSDNKINSLEKRAFISSRNSQSLEIYKEWFKTKNIQNRNVYRIIEDDEKQNTLGNIHDISIKDFCNRIDKNPKIYKKEIIFYSNAKINNIVSKNTILSLIKEENSKKLLFPLDFVSLQHNKDNQQTIIEKIDSKVEKLIKQVEKIFKIMGS